ncbi:MAG: YciI family protein [Planctomycetes bacterium]|nr:YciI family protein [Planctomycetota bacterium]
MRYLLMIAAEEDQACEHPGTPEYDELMGRYMAFTEEIMASGSYLESLRLKPVAHATSVRVRNGKAAVTDGPFTETKEKIGGFYLIEAPDLDAAMAWAKKIPSADIGTIEIRPVWEMDEPEA